MLVSVVVGLTMLSLLHSSDHLQGFAGRLRTGGSGAFTRAIARPRLVATLLAVALTAHAAMTVYRLGSLLNPRPQKDFPADHTGAAHSTSMSVAAIAGAHLFGALPAADQPEKAPVTSAPFVLTGTIALGDPADGFALIGGDAKSTQMYAVGSSIADGITLREVYTDRALIVRGGQVETLWMPRSSLLSDLMPHPVAVADVSVPRSAPPVPDEVRERLDYENTRVGTAFVETPLMNMEQFRGLKVEAGPDPAILKQMGLKPGDVIQGVDGILIDLEHVDLLRKALASGRKVRLGVLRSQEGPVDLEIDPVQVQGLISN